MTRQCEFCSHFMHANSLTEGVNIRFPLQRELIKGHASVCSPSDTHKSAFKLQMTDAVSCPQQMIRNGVLLYQRIIVFLKSKNFRYCGFNFC